MIFSSVLCDNLSARKYCLMTSMFKVLVIFCMVLPSDDNSVLQQAVPDDLSHGVLPILRGCCFQVHSPNNTFVFLSHISHMHFSAICVVWHLVVQPCISAVENILLHLSYTNQAWQSASAHHTVLHTYLVIPHTYPFSHPATSLLWGGGGSPGGTTPETNEIVTNICSCHNFFSLSSVQIIFIPACCLLCVL